MGLLNREVGEIELIPVAKGMLARWWIVLIAALLGTIAMWSQESDLSTTPAITEVVRTYESRDETALLSLVGIDPATISPFPSFENQVLQVQEESMRKAIAEKIGFSASVSVAREEQRFSLINTNQGDGLTKFTFLSVGTPKYTFYCSDVSEERCNTALDEYLVQLKEVRKQSIISGLDRLQLLLESLPLDTQSNVERIEAIKATKPLVKGELALLSTTSTAVGATVSSVKSSTYAFGFAGGALVGLLVALQLTLVDKRVRSLSQLTKRFESQSLIGMVTSESASIQHVAAAVVARAHALSISSVALVPVDEQTKALKLSEKLDAITASMGVRVTSLAPISSLSASDLISSHSGMITLASRGVSVTEEIAATWSVLDSAQKPILGVLLTEPAL
ncbi:MAG: hypothetical protein RL729_829 [Actinomycetota bacterium]|jgi:hypothetical protein